MVLIDLRKAFDLVDHKLLVHKLSLYGCKTRSLNWFKSYLCERQQCVSYDGHMSSCMTMSLGVPQGSILGPLLFIVFMNDLVLEVETNLEMYADDSTLYDSGSVEYINDSLSTDLQPVNSWITENCMVLNYDKTESMLLGTLQKVRRFVDKFSVGSENYKIMRVDAHKLVGVHVDSSLTWGLHVKKLCAKLKSRLYLFNRIKHLLPQKCREAYFSGLVQPLIDYGCVVWGNCSKELLLKVHKCMKMYARSILNIKDKHATRTTQLFKTLGWMPIDVRVKYFEGIQMYNIINDTAPQYLRECFTHVSGVHRHNTRNRHRDNLTVPSFKLATGQRSFMYRGAILWNCLDEHIKCSPTIDIFKVRYAKYLKTGLYDHEQFSLDKSK